MTGKNQIRSEIDKMNKHLDIVMQDLINVIVLLRDNDLTKEAEYFNVIGEELYVIKESLNQLYSYF